MTIGRLGQIPRETLRTNLLPNARLGQVCVETLRTEKAAPALFLQLGQIPSETLRKSTLLNVLLYQVAVEYVRPNAAPLIVGSWSDSFTLSDAYTGKGSVSYSIACGDAFTLTDVYTGKTPANYPIDCGDSFTLTDTQTGQGATPATCSGLPPGWVMLRVLETVPNPNFGTPYGNTGFVRWTYITTDENGQYVCASGSEQDCCTQSHAMAEQRTQRRPFNEALP